MNAIAWFFSNQLAPLSTNTDKPYDIAIVGAGVAGLYCAWRLVREGQGSGPLRIIVLERSSRVGGRLKTTEAKIHGKRILVEEGGMRFLRSHQRLWKLLQELGLSGKIKPFGMGDKNNLFYLRGNRFTREESHLEAHRKWRGIYNLRENEKGKSPFDITNDVLRRLTESFDDIGPWTPDNLFKWTRLRRAKYPRINGSPIYQWGFRALLADLGLSSECVQMLADTGGFSIPYEEMVSAGSGLQLIASFPENPEFFTLSDGYEELTDRLALRVKDMGVRIDTSFSVEKLVRADRSFRVEVMSKYRTAISADKVILALPVRPMQHLLREQEGINVRSKAGHLDKIVHMPLTKMNLFFEEDWWSDQGITNGGCFTDLPLAQVYFFKVETDDPDRQFNAITIYSDGRRSNYWQQLQNLGVDYRHTRADAHRIDTGNLEICKKIVVSHALRQLKEMFGTESIREPIFATISQWGHGELGEGDHQWSVGADDEMIRDELAEIDKGLYLCGEAISDYQDWVEGALRSVDRMLERGFALESNVAS